MKIYAEYKKAKKFDWNEWLDNAISKNLQKAPAFIEKKAKSWTTCACGNQCAVIPRDSDGEPDDERLRRLGMQFWSEIYSGNWKLAKSILQQIEKRSDKLIAGIKKLL